MLVYVCTCTHMYSIYVCERYGLIVYLHTHVTHCTTYVHLYNSQFPSIHWTHWVNNSEVYRHGMAWAVAVLSQLSKLWHIPPCTLCCVYTITYTWCHSDHYCLTLLHVCVHVCVCVCVCVCSTGTPQHAKPSLYTSHSRLLSLATMRCFLSLPRQIQR